MNRLKKISEIRGRLRNGGHSIGSWMQIPNASIAEILGQAGYEWVAIDMEHGAVSAHQMPDLFRALELGGTLPMVRLAQGHAKDCKQALDAGAGGVIIPMVETASQLMSICDACGWPPAGSRGVGFSRANLYGKHFKAYAEEAQAPLLVPMIENIIAVDALEEMLSASQIDALLIGPYDLSASMNITGQFENSRFREVIKKICKIADAFSVPCGIHIVEPSQGELKAKLSEGYRFIPYSIDAVFLNHFSRCPNTSDYLMKMD